MVRELAQILARVRAAQRRGTIEPALESILNARFADLGMGKLSRQEDFEDRLDTLIAERQANKNREAQNIIDNVIEKIDDLLGES